jgi:carbamoyltransferase
MVLTARARPEARLRIPAVIHADGTGRFQIVREHTDPLTHAYLKALGRRKVALGERGHTYRSAHRYP